MAGERKENSVLFSLKELKDFTSDDPAEPAARPASASKAAPTPTPRRPSALDDMGSLLADIRSTVNEDVEAEARRLEEEKKRQRDEEDRKIKQTSALQKADIEARIAAEQARREGGRPGHRRGAGPLPDRCDPRWQGPSADGAQGPARAL